MRILVVSHEYPPIGGGGANACYYLCHEFAARGYEVTVVTADYSERVESDERIEFIRLRCKREHKEHCSFAEMLDFLLKAAGCLNKLVKRRHFDICLVFFGIPAGPVGLFLKKRYGLPYIVRLGGGDIPGAQKRFKLIYKIIAPFVRRIWKNAEAIVANSNGLKQRALGFEDRYEISIVPNGVDFSQFYPNENKMDGQEKVLLFVGRILEGKGLQDILPYLDNIVYRSGKPIRFLIVGDGEYKETLEELAKKQVNNCKVEFIGYKEKKDLCDFYQMADIFVFPSHSEGMPNVVLEAMACGLPIVMTPCEGSEELIDDNGYVTAASNFQEAIIRLLEDDKERKRMGEASRNKILKEFSWGYCADRYLNFVNKEMEIEGK